MSPQEPECLEQILFSAGDIARRVELLGSEIARDYADRDLVLIAALKGAAIFLADLTRAIPIPHAIDFIGISSYQNEASTGAVTLNTRPPAGIRGKHVLLVEDIYDSGLSIQALQDIVRPLQPASLEACALLFKERRRAVQIPIRYIGFHVPDLFVVGYGLDYNELYRNLPCIGVLRPELRAAAQAS